MSSAYVVLARKWRPQLFADLTGQGHVAQTLTNALERGRVPHALLFTGARGVGKTSCARILAMALNCAEGTTTTPCGTCDSCQEIQRGQSVDVLEIDGASNRGINEIRELRDGVRYAPNRDRYKVYIIDEVHMLTTEAFNALLKTLEEPPPHVVFIFATTEAQKIPVTILSRCQRFDFRRIAHADIVGRLREICDAEGIDVDAEVLGIVARQAAGGMRDALSLLDQVIAFAGTTIRIDDAEGILGAAERRRLSELSDALIDRDVERALRVVDDVDAFGVDIAHFAMELVGHLRDLAIVSVSNDPGHLTTLTDGEIADAKTQVGRTDIGTLQRMFELMVEAAEAIARSNHPRLLFEMAIVRITSIEPAHTVASLVAHLEALAGGRALPPGQAGGAPASGRGSTAQSTGGAAAGRESGAKPTPRDEADEADEPEPEPSLSADPEPEPVRAAEPKAETEPVRTADPDPDAEPVHAAEPESEPMRTEETGARAEAPPEREPGVGEPLEDGLTSDAWRAIVNSVREEVPHEGELLAGARACADGGDVRLAMPVALMERVQPDLLTRLNRLAAQLNGSDVAFRAVEMNEVGADELAGSFHVAGIEAAEEAARIEAAKSYVTNHEATALVMNHFPGSTIARIEVPDAPRENP